MHNVRQLLPWRSAWRRRLLASPCSLARDAVSMSMAATRAPPVLSGPKACCPRVAVLRSPLLSSAVHAAALQGRPAGPLHHHVLLLLRQPVRYTAPALRWRQPAPRRDCPAPAPVLHPKQTPTARHHRPRHTVECSPHATHLSLEACPRSARWPARLPITAPRWPTKCSGLVPHLCAPPRED